MRKVRLIAALMMIQLVIKAQDSQVDRNNDLWFFNLTKMPVNERWGIENELHFRLADWGSTKQQFLIRPSVSYKANDNLVFHVGYTHIQNYPYGDQAIQTRLPENNVWIQVTLNHKMASIGISHRYRLEERWIGQWNGDTANPEVGNTVHGNRIRYRLTLRKELTNQKNYIAVFDEIWFQFGENAGLNRFNQNWVYAGIGQKIGAQVALELGYMWQVIEKSDGLRYESNNTFQFTLHLNLQKQKI